MNESKIFTPTELRKAIINSVLAVPVLGVNYIDYHYEDGRCGLALNLGSYGGEFEIIIVRPETSQFGNEAFVR